MALPIIDVNTLEKWGPAQDARDTELMERLVLSASQYLEQETGRVFRAPDADQSYVLDGDDAMGKYRDILRLNFCPLVSVTSVTENGAALTIGAGYAPTADVITRLSDGMLLRNALTSWSEGKQNILVVARPGYVTIPADVVQACIELTRALYKESRRSGVESMTRAGMTSNFVREHAPFVERTIALYKDWRRAL